MEEWSEEKKQRLAVFHRRNVNVQSLKIVDPLGGSIIAVKAVLREQDTSHWTEIRTQVRDDPEVTALARQLLDRVNAILVARFPAPGHVAPDTEG